MSFFIEKARNDVLFTEFVISETREKISSGKNDIS